MMTFLIYVALIIGCVLGTLSIMFVFKLLEHAQTATIMSYDDAFITCKLVQQNPNTCYQDTPNFKIMAWIAAQHPTLKEQFSELPWEHYEELEEKIGKPND